MSINIKCALAKARRKYRLSQSELAILAGVSRSTISFIENGRQDPTKSMMVKIARALDMSVIDIFFDDSERHANRKKNNKKGA